MRRVKVSSMAAAYTRALKAHRVMREEDVFMKMVYCQLSVKTSIERYEGVLKKLSVCHRALMLILWYGG